MQRRGSWGAERSPRVLTVPKVLQWGQPSRLPVGLQPLLWRCGSERALSAGVDGRPGACGGERPHSRGRVLGKQVTAAGAVAKVRMAAALEAALVAAAVDRPARRSGVMAAERRGAAQAAQVAPAVTVTAKPGELMLRGAGGSSCLNSSRGRSRFSLSTPAAAGGRGLAAMAEGLPDRVSPDHRAGILLARRRWSWSPPT